MFLFYVFIYIFVIKNKAVLLIIITLLECLYVIYKKAKKDNNNNKTNKQTKIKMDLTKFIYTETLEANPT